MSGPPPPEELEKIRQILVWVGVANQLFVTRLNRAIATLDLPFGQFVMLNHFANFPDEGHSVTRLANALETGQPGVTKICQRLVEKGYLRVEPDPHDGRVKQHFITVKGSTAHREAITRIAPDAQLIFRDWGAADITELHRLLFKLKSWLDDNRELRPE